MTKHTTPESAGADTNISEYVAGSWFDCQSVDQMQKFFLSRLEPIRRAAKEHGYAIALHGSCRRDLDLIATPWVENHSSPDVLAWAVQRAACGITQSKYSWESKPAGRVATSFPICWVGFDYDRSVKSMGHLDLSVVTALTAAQANTVQQPSDDDRCRALKDLNEWLKSWPGDHDDDLIVENAETIRAALQETPKERAKRLNPPVVLQPTSPDTDRIMQVGHDVCTMLDVIKAKGGAPKYLAIEDENTVYALRKLPTSPMGDEQKRAIESFERLLEHVGAPQYATTQKDMDDIKRVRASLSRATPDYWTPEMRSAAMADAAKVCELQAKLDAQSAAVKSVFPLLDLRGEPQSKGE